MSISISDIIVFEITNEIKDEARNASLKKFPNINDTFVVRDSKTKYQTSFEGDMAKLAVKKWLESNGEVVIDWDNERNDNFKKSDKPYDLSIGEKTIEIRSSKEFDKKIDFILKHRSIIQPKYATVFDITIQAYWLKSDFSSINIIAWAKKAELENEKYIKSFNNNEFYMMPFTDPNAYSLRELLSYI